MKRTRFRNRQVICYSGGPFMDDPELSAKLQFRFPAAAPSYGLNEQPEGWRGGASVGIVEMIPRQGWQAVLQDSDRAPFTDMWVHLIAW